MSEEGRQRLLRLVRRPDADLAEAALLCGAELPGTHDVETSLLRVHALADALASSGFRSGVPEDDAEALTSHLARTHGFTGDRDTYHDPANSLLGEVLDRQRGLPITLTILYVAIGRRLHVPIFPIALPGHVVAGVGEGQPVVIDPFHDGRRLDEAEITRRVEAATDGRLPFRRSMLRPSPAANMVRRLLNNLTRDLARSDRTPDAVRAVELRLLLPNRLPDDHRVLGELLGQIGRFDEAADAYEAYLRAVSEEAPDREEVRRAAVRARARLN